MATLSDTIPGVMALAGVTLMLIILLRKYFRHTGRLKRASRRESKPRYASAAAAQRKKLEMPPGCDSGRSNFTRRAAT